MRSSSDPELGLLLHFQRILSFVCFSDKSWNQCRLFRSPHDTQMRHVLSHLPSHLHPQHPHKQELRRVEYYSPSWFLWTEYFIPFSVKTVWKNPMGCCLFQQEAGKASRKAVSWRLGLTTGTAPHNHLENPSRNAGTTCQHTLIVSSTILCNPDIRDLIWINISDSLNVLWRPSSDFISQLFPYCNKN